MFGKENLVGIVFREHRAGVKAHAKGCYVRTKHLYRWGVIAAGFVLPKFRIGNITLVAVWITKMHTRRWGSIEFVAGDIVPQVVAAIFGKPYIFSLRMPAKTNRIADTPCKYFHAGTIGIYAGNGSINGIAFIAIITGCANRHI